MPLSGSCADFCDALKRASDIVLREGSPQDPSDRAEGFRYLSRLTRVVVESYIEFADWAEGLARRGVNQRHRLDPAVANAAHGDPNIVYYHGYLELGADEALVIETTPPACDYWNLQINNHWMESLDYRYHTIAVNHHDATYRPDGSVRIVGAHENPGVANWLETAGHRRGTMCWRWIRAASHPQPATRVVKSADLPT